MAGETDKGPISITLTAWIIAAIGICSATWFIRFYHEHDFWLAFMVGLHNTLFDVLFIGVLIFWLNKRVENRIEIRRYLEELRVWKGQGTLEAKNRLELFIGRLNDLGTFDVPMPNSMMIEINLTGMSLVGSDLSGSNLYGAILNSADLRKTRLDNADLKNASLAKADLRQASLLGANLDYADLRETQLQGANFTGARIQNVRWDSATWDDRTIFPYPLTDLVKRKMTYLPRSEHGVLSQLTQILKGREKPPGRDS